MAALSTGLGKGLDALIRETSEARDTSSVQVLPIKDISPNPHQPRRSFDEKTLEELAASIRSQGVLQPLLVRPCGPAKPGKYEIVAGERRWRASQLAGLTEVPVLVRSFSAQDTLAAALIENLQREDLNPLEEALGIQTLKMEFGLSQDDLAKKLGKSRSAIANSLRLLSLPENVRNDLAEGRLSAGHARALLSITDPQALERLRNLIIDRRLSVREAEGLAVVWKETGTLDPQAFAAPSFEGNADASVEVETQPQEAETTCASPNAEQDPNANAPSAEGKKSKPQSAKLLEIQSRISNVLNTAVRVTGKEDKGKISLSYNSKEELEAILTRLATPALEAQTRPSLSGSESLALEGQALSVLDAQQHQPLSGQENHPLSGLSSPALAGSTHEALTGTEHASLTGAKTPPSLSATENVALSGTRNVALAGASNAAISASDHVALGASNPQALAGARSAALDASRPSEAPHDAEHKAPSDK